MNFDRSTNTPTALAIANVVCRGGTSDWRRLYRDLKEKPALRSVALRALTVADTEAALGSILLFREAIRDMDDAPLAPGPCPLPVEPAHNVAPNPYPHTH